MIAVPYHLGERETGVGQGPLRIAESLGYDCQVLELPAPDPLWGRLSSGGGLLTRLGILNRHLADVIAQLPDPQLILAGCCNNALGALAGLAKRGIDRLGIVWFDAHGDFNTPQTSLSGSPDGMALAAAAGDCPDLSAASGLTEFVPQENIVLVASRDLDPEERARLNASPLSRVGIEDLPPTLESLVTRVDAVYLHIDLDVLDPALSPGVNCTTAGGLTPGQLLAAIRELIARIPVAAATIANYNPDRDADKRTLEIACHLAGTLHQVLTGGCHAGGSYAGGRSG